MKHVLKSRTKETSHETLFGITSVGEKGQVVIPANIRTAMKLTKGEKLIAFMHNGSTTLVPASKFEETARRFSVMRDHILKEK